MEQKKNRLFMPAEWHKQQMVQLTWPHEGTDWNYMLDEVEAALDDVNVVRYAQYVRRMTKNTQFIVITHRRGTMTSADRLYGITMQEKGVSTLVSVNLLEAELQEQEDKS